MPTPAALREFEATLDAELGPDVPSVACGIWQGGGTVFLSAKGLADREGNVAATPQTPYSLASVTKPMTSTAVMMLAERGLVDLDAPMEGAQGRAGDAREATVRRVIDHTAGLPLHHRFYYADEPVAPTPFPETVRRYAKTFTPPGERSVYSNLGYGLLDELIARTSGVSYARFMAEEVFAPLGMAHATIDASEGAAIAYGPGGLVYPRYGFDHAGGSAAYASVEDLLAFGRFHLGHGADLLSPEGRRRMREPGPFGYGLGWSARGRVVQHTGGMGGVRTILRLVPDLDLVVALLANGEDDLVFRAASEAVALFDPSLRPSTVPEAIIEPAPFGGRWRGRIETHAGDRALEVDVERGTIRLEGAERKLDDLCTRDERLSGTFEGDLGTEDAGRRPYRVHLDLTLRDGALNGAATAIGLPGGRQGDALGYWTELTPL